LFQCGASTLSPGIHGVTKSGLAAAAAALDCGEEELLASKSGALRVYSAEDPSSWASSEGQETGDADQLDGLGLPLRWNDDLDRTEVAP
jgi:hypothetical protein